MRKEDKKVFAPRYLEIHRATQMSTCILVYEGNNE